MKLNQALHFPLQRLNDNFLVISSLEHQKNQDWRTEYGNYDLGKEVAAFNLIPAQPVQKCIK
jgi:hypothetical protein